MNVTSKTASTYDLTEAARMAAQETSVRLYNLRDSGRGIAFTLKTGAPSEWREDWRGRRKLMPKYQRQSQRERHSTAKGREGEVFYPTVPGAVCWHGHRAFLRALFARIPDATVRTAMATYKGREHFEQTHEETYYAGGDRMGYPIQPYGQACSCEEDGK